MNQILNGKINEHGVIVPFNDTADIIYNKAEDSLLYREYKSGSVNVSIYLAEFDDSQAACSSEVQVAHTGYGFSPTISNKAERRTAITKELERIIRFLDRVLTDNDSCKSKSTDTHCRKVLSRVRADLCILSDCGVLRPVHTEALTLPLVF